LETFSQLLVRDTDASTILLRNTPVSVKDSPRYPHRGILIDTSRHYLSVDQIKRVIDSLPTNK
jgi:hexosaminidase